MNILVINCGSSSLKFQLINSESEECIAKGLCERIGIEGSMITYAPAGGEKEKKVTPMPDHTEAIRLVLEALMNETTGVVKNLDEIGAVGHRIVHGGEKFTSSAIINDEVIAAITECNDLAPLHNPANLIGIEACKTLMPATPMVAVFDTAFHQTMPEEAYMYGLPYEYYTKYKVRRYGFHGTSHSYVSKKAAEVLGKDYESLKTIVCHLGNGASVSAVKNGKCVDTSMGLTPLEGLIMGTRSGDVDPAIIEFLANKEGKTAQEVVSILNKKSGVLGLSNGLSSDFRDIEEDSEIIRSVIEYHNTETPAKFEAALQIINDIISKGGKVVVWACYIKTIELFKDCLAERGISSRTLFGATPVAFDGMTEEDEGYSDTREAIIKEFHNPNSEFKVIIANPFAVAESISLHKACHNAIYIERSFNCAHFIQSKDRIHRYGLASNIETHYYYLVSENTIDTVIDERLSEKEQRLLDIIESMPIPLFDNVFEDAGNEDIKAVLKNYAQRIKEV